MLFSSKVIVIKLITSRQFMEIFGKCSILEADHLDLIIGQSLTTFCFGAVLTLCALEASSVKWHIFHTYVMNVKQVNSWKTLRVILIHRTHRKPSKNLSYPSSVVFLVIVNVIHIITVNCSLKTELTLISLSLSHTHTHAYTYFPLNIFYVNVFMRPSKIKNGNHNIGEHGIWFINLRRMLMDFLYWSWSISRCLVLERHSLLF